jgi:ubiquinone/menaquinone biosynthesis C-methylase UbiE
VELHEEYLNIARKKVRDLELSNVEFIHGRAEDVILKGEFDCIVSDYLAKYVDLDLLVAHAWRMLRKGGLLVMHELTRPTRPLFLALWNIHFKFLQAYGNWKHPEWNMAFNDVPFLLTRTRWVDELTRALRANRFSDIEIENQMFGASVIVSARK